MLSYRHAYHAGNYADVLKHLVLSYTLSYLTKKPAAIRYIDTHAGAGGYSLQSEQALKTDEYKQGIARLWQSTSLPDVLQCYIDLVTEYNQHKPLSRYPGSPWFAQQLLREQDKLELCELHSSDFPRLQKSFRQDKRVRCYHEDGFQRSLALVPPIERRGVVLIDPAYEVKQDYQTVVSHTQALYKRFATGVYLLWYPVIEWHRIEKLQRAFMQTGIRRIQLYELSLTSDHAAPGMTGSGMLVINPPWTLQRNMQTALAAIAPLFSDDGHAYYRVEELVGE